MYTSTTSAQPDSRPEGQTFASTDDFLAAVKPGMDLCTSDFTGWATVVGVDPAAAVVVGRVNEDEREVHVPVTALIDMHGGHCVRVDRVRATIDAQGWDA